MVENKEKVTGKFFFKYRNLSTMSINYEDVDKVLHE